MIAVTGITGHSGGFLLEQFMKNNCGDTIRCFVRESSNTAALDASGLKTEKVCGSFETPDDLRRFTEGADTLIHLAGIWKTPALLKAAEETGGVRHAVLVHTTGIFSKHKIASEDYKRIEGEMQPFLDRGMNVTLLRPTMIFGDMRDRNISKFIRMVDRLPVMPEIDRGRALIQPVNARDIGQACYKAAMIERLPELGYNISGERPLTLHELVDLIGEYLGKRVRHVSCPMGLGAAGARALKALSGGRIDYVEKVLRMGEDRSFSHEAATRDFGYEPEKFETGLRREVEEYMANGRQ